MKEVESASAAKPEAAALVLDGLAAELAKDRDRDGHHATRIGSAASTIQKRARSCA